MSALHYRCACCGTPTYGTPLISCDFCEWMVEFINEHVAGVALRNVAALTNGPRKLLIER